MTKMRRTGIPVVNDNISSCSRVQSARLKFGKRRISTQPVVRMSLIIFLCEQISLKSVLRIERARRGCVTKSRPLDVEINGGASSDRFNRRLLVGSDLSNRAQGLERLTDLRMTCGRVRASNLDEAGRFQEQGKTKHQHRSRANDSKRET
ncbi:hypothetical protein DFH09DRAFT_1188345 [Mycena vulgaris]|nr:hypothetical protein DFH09DRAFT_1188345 [Mycena vulgaris]